MIGKHEVAAAILAGGRARRMGGVAKPLLEVDGRAIVDRLVDALAPYAGEIVVAVADVAQAPPGLRAIVDVVPGAGPLAGLAAARAAVAAPWLVAVAGDMPYVTAEVIAALLARTGPDVDAVAPRVALGGGEPLPEPLLAVWGPAAGPLPCGANPAPAGCGGD